MKSTGINKWELELREAQYLQELEEKRRREQIARLEMVRRERQEAEAARIERERQKMKIESIYGISLGLYGQEQLY